MEAHYSTTFFTDIFIMIQASAVHRPELKINQWEAENNNRYFHQSYFDKLIELILSFVLFLMLKHFLLQIVVDRLREVCIKQMYNLLLTFSCLNLLSSHVKCNRYTN